jgi:hypothetical protein
MRKTANLPRPLLRRVVLQPHLSGALICPEVDCRVRQPMNYGDAVALPKRSEALSPNDLLESLQEAYATR